MEALLIFWAVVWICKNAAEDVMGAVKGRPSPRRVRQLKRIEEAGGTPGYGVGGYVRDFADDFLRARTEKRRELAEKRKREAAAPADVPGPEVKPVTTFTPQAPETPGGPKHAAPDPDDDTRRVDPLSLNGRSDYRPPQVGEAYREEGTQARYRWDGDVWVKTHNADGTEIPLCPSCGRRRYKAMGDGCGHCAPIEAAGQHYTVCTRCNYLNGPTAQWPFTCPACGAGDEHLEPATAPTEEDQQADPSPPVAPVIPIFRTPYQQEVPPMTEVTGLMTAIQYAQGVAAAHQDHATDAEAFAASLASNEVGDGTLGLASVAQEASAAAAAAWQAVADDLEAQNIALKEAYDAAPDAGSREFVTSE